MFTLFHRVNFPSSEERQARYIRYNLTYLVHVTKRGTDLDLVVGLQHRIFCRINFLEQKAVLGRDDDETGWLIKKFISCLFRRWFTAGCTDSRYASCEQHRSVALQLSTAGQAQLCGPHDKPRLIWMV